MDDLMKKYFAGIHGFVPNKPTLKATLTGKVSKLVKRSK